MNKQEKLRNIIAYIMAFVLSVVLTLTTLLVGVKSTFFHETFILNQLDKSDYSTHVYEYFVDVSESLSILYGVDEEYLLSSFSKEKVEQDILRSMKMTLRNQTPDFFKEDLSNQVEQSLLAYAQSIDLTITTEVQEGISELKDELIKDYARIIQVPLFKNYAQAKGVVDQYIWWAIGALVALSLFLIGFLLKLFRHRHRALRMIAYATIAVGMMNLIILFPVYTSRFYEQIQISPQFFKILITSVVKTSLVYMMLYSIVWFVLSLGLTFWSESLRKKTSKKVR